MKHLKIDDLRRNDGLEAGESADVRGGVSHRAAPLQSESEQDALGSGEDAFSQTSYTLWSPSFAWSAPILNRCETVVRD